MVDGDLDIAVPSDEVHERSNVGFCGLDLLSPAGNFPEVA